MSEINAMAINRLLVVDDDEAILDEFRQTFAALTADHSDDDLEADLFGAAPAAEPAAHFELTTCNQGHQAVTAVKHACDADRRFAAAFMDVRMPPGIDGVNAAKQIRQIDPQLPIVFITGFSDRPAAELQNELPPADKVRYVAKPFRVGDFVSLVIALGTR